MSPGDLPNPLKEVMAWGGGLIALALGILGVRARKSTDDTQRAKNTAEAGIYSGTLADVTTDRNRWIDAYRKLETLNGELREQVARHMALQETHEHEIQSLREQHTREINHLHRDVDSLRRMVRRFAPPAFREALGPDFEGSRAGDLDDPRGPT